ncbi:LysR substrate-binding domain-containing protein [Paraburkholderia sediminicola]|uniref:LysR substrate-binding domain-containing protein n=1 Tax=Paraburkholderia sediminicola TaxID=458836 RepID=UPI0038B8A7A8
MRDYHAAARNVNLIVSIQEDTVNLYDGRFDIAILPPHLVEQSAVIRRTLSRSPRILVAAPAYLAQFGVPKTASQLANHFLLLAPDSRQKDSGAIEVLEDWRKIAVFPMSSMDGNEVLLRAAALTATGIAILPEVMVREDIADGYLTHVLPNCSTSDDNVEIRLFYSHRELLPARMRTFADFCADLFAQQGAASFDEVKAVLSRMDRQDSEPLTAALVDRARGRSRVIRQRRPGKRNASCCCETAANQIDGERKGDD